MHTRVHHREPDHCPCCEGRLPADLVERIRSAKPVGKPMSAEQFMEWLKRSA